MGTIDGSCNVDGDCSTLSGLSCQQTSCQCSQTFKWNPQTLSCDLCAQSYTKNGSYCGLVYKFFLYFRNSLLKKNFLEVCQNSHNLFDNRKYCNPPPAPLSVEFHGQVRTPQFIPENPGKLFKCFFFLKYYPPCLF